MVTNSLAGQLVEAGTRGLAVVGEWLMYAAADFLLAAVGLMFLVVGALLTRRGLRPRVDTPEPADSAGRPVRREANRGCVLAVGVPFVLLGITILAFIAWVNLSV